jgi:phytoene synthase
MKASPADAAAIFRRGGKSFWFASLFLPAAAAADAARLYAFCRRMDDLADVAVTERSRALLARVRAEVRAGVSADPWVLDFIALARRYALPSEAVDYLIGALLEDATRELALETETQLVQYCYGVAGTVGLMMSPLLGADARRAGEAAVHLGIAMQMTNIARDVLEDARRGRRYLPGCWLEHKTADDLVTSIEARPVAAAAVARLLNLADEFYRSAAAGFPLIPRRARRGIEIAATVYRAIGTELRRKHCAWWEGRVSVSLPTKLWLALRVCAGRSELVRLPPAPAARELSRPLAGLPGIP